MALMTALTVGGGAFAFLSKRGARGWKAAAVGGVAAERTPKYIPWVRWGRERRSEATAEKHSLGLRVGGGAACVKGC